MSRTTILLVSTLAGAIASAAACNTGTAPSPSMGAPPDQGDAAATPVPPFQADPAGVYVAKIKNILVGLPPTDAEVQAAANDKNPPTQLKSLVDGWMKLPEYQTKMLRFFELAFQQTQVTVTDFADQAFPVQIDINGSTQTLIVQNLEESFARTVLQLNSQAAPFTGTMTTQTFMMTPAMMELYAFLDVWQVDDFGKVTDRFKIANPTLNLYAEAAQGPIPIADTLDPANANYMHWYDPDVANAATTQGPGCGQDPIIYPAPSGLTLHSLLWGGLIGRTNPTGGKCLQNGGTAMAPQFAPTDFTTWKMVTIRPPMAGEQVTAFYDLPTLRSTSTLVLNVPRVGFFSTPAFFANWQTNTSNEMRVTTNQSLIVATGAMIDGTDPTVPTSTPGLDSAHASPGSPCYVCHQLLDPTRSILAATYSWNYHDQTEALYATQKGLFAFQGVIKPVNTVMDFGTILAQHPLFAQAWAQKLCYYVNSAACETTDPEFQRIVGVFTSSSYSWDALVKELVTSPLTTYAVPTKTVTDNGEVVAVSRRDHLCAALNARLGFTDICGLDALTKAQQATAIPEIVSGLPSDGYGRGAVAPVLPNQPTLFYRAATENICEAVAALVIDVPAGKQIAGVTQWSSTASTAAITDFVNLIMGLAPSDPRAQPATMLLQSHYNASLQAGATATEALQSTFTTACLAPSAVSIGL